MPTRAAAQTTAEKDKDAPVPAQRRFAEGADEDLGRQPQARPATEEDRAREQMAADGVQQERIVDKEAHGETLAKPHEGPANVRTGTVDLRKRPDEPTVQPGNVTVNGVNISVSGRETNEQLCAVFEGAGRGMKAHLTGDGFLEIEWPTQQTDRLTLSGSAATWTSLGFMIP